MNPFFFIAMVLTVATTILGSALLGFLFWTTSGDWRMRMLGCVFYSLAIRDLGEWLGMGFGFVQRAVLKPPGVWMTWTSRGALAIAIIVLICVTVHSRYKGGPDARL
jgi:hypothetical protein